MRTVAPRDGQPPEVESAFGSVDRSGRTSQGGRVRCVALSLGAQMCGAVKTHPILTITIRIRSPKSS